MMNLEALKGRVKGIFPPIATPLTETEAFDEQGMRRLVDYLLESGVHGLFVLGSTGEFATFTQAERQRIIEVVVDETAGRVPILANATEVGTKKTVDSARVVAEAGADKTTARMLTEIQARLDHLDGGRDMERMADMERRMKDLEDA